MCLFRNRPTASTWLLPMIYDARRFPDLETRIWDPRDQWRTLELTCMARGLPPAGKRVLCTCGCGNIVCSKTAQRHQHGQAPMLTRIGSTRGPLREVTTTRRTFAAFANAVASPFRSLTSYYGQRFARRHQREIVAASLQTSDALAATPEGISCNITKFYQSLIQRMQYRTGYCHEQP